MAAKHTVFNLAISERAPLMKLIKCYIDILL